MEIIRLESSEQVIDSIGLTLAFALAIAWTCEKLQKKNDNAPTSLSSPLPPLFLLLSSLKETGRLALPFSLSQQKEKERLFVIRLIPRLVLFRFNRKPLCGEVSREARCTAEAGALLRARYPPRLILVSGIGNGNYEAIKRGNADLLDRMDGGGVKWGMFRLDGGSTA